ncbi:type IV secretory system conjugative DNA transfer family protein [Brevibacillus sp. NPDC003359]|uniref:type IV secretory system conjugative DNA transfer family protein n=1 Tax=unclassified Brevibacillus TaxID=2684853 RepID=UPI0036AE274C
MSSYKRWLPFAIITSGYLLILKCLLLSINQIITIMSFAPWPNRDLFVQPEQYSLIDIVRVITIKMWYSSPERVDFGPSVVSDFVETFVGTFYGLSLGAFCGLVWVLSTRVEFKIRNTQWWSGPLPRWIMFITATSTVFLQFIIWAQLPIYESVLPKIEEAIVEYQKSDFMEYSLETINNIVLFNRLLLFIPIGFIMALVVFMVRKWKEHRDELEDVFYEWQFKSSKVRKLFTGQRDISYPDIYLGKEKSTGEEVIQLGEDRNLNTGIVGSIGAGKTSTVVLQTVNQDLNYMVDFINNFADETDEERTNQVNGIVIIEPSNDLCKKAYQLAKAKNIPEEAIYYLDPLYKDTVSINPIRGPIEKAVETFTKIIQGLAENSNEFFRQSQRSHLKHYVYLLKLAKQNNATFDDLMELYQDARLVADLVEVVEKTIPSDWEQIEERDMRNHWLIVKGIISWFKERGLLYLEDKNQMKLTYPNKHKHAGKQMVVDKQAEFVQGLRNILDDISSSKLIRRVLFGNSDFDIDTHLKAGGVLLLHTAKGDLAELSNVLGKFGVMLVENGIFRRDASERDPFHTVTVDEFPDYNYDRFRELPAQSRKYHANIQVAAQSVAQLAIDYGDDYLYTLFSAFRHKIVFGDCDFKTAEFFSNLFGEKDVYESSESEQVTSSIMSAPGRRDGVTVTKSKKQRLTPSEIIHLKKFYAAIKTVGSTARVVKTRFVSKLEFIRPRKRVDRKKAEAWLEYRRKLMAEMENQLLRDLGILKEGEINPIDAVPVKEIEKLESLLQGQPLYLNELDKKAVNTLAKKTMISLDIDSYSKADDTTSAPQEVKNKQDMTIPPSQTKDKVIEPAIQVVPAQVKESMEEDLFSSIYNQVDTIESDSTSEQSKMDLSNDPKIKKMVEEFINAQTESTDQDEEDDLASLIKLGSVTVDDVKEEAKQEDTTLTKEELYREIQTGRK